MLEDEDFPKETKGLLFPRLSFLSDTLKCPWEAVMFLFFNVKDCSEAMSITNIKKIKIQKWSRWSSSWYACLETGKVVCYVCLPPLRCV